MNAFDQALVIIRTRWICNGCLRHRAGVQTDHHCIARDVPTPELRPEDPQ